MLALVLRIVFRITEHRGWKQKSLSIAFHHHFHQLLSKRNEQSNQGNNDAAFPSTKTERYQSACVLSKYTGTQDLRVRTRLSPAGLLVPCESPSSRHDWETWRLQEELRGWGLGCITCFYWEGEIPFRLLQMINLCPRAWNVITPYHYLSLPSKLHLLSVTSQSFFFSLKIRRTLVNHIGKT